MGVRSRRQRTQPPSASTLERAKEKAWWSYISVRGEKDPAVLSVEEIKQ